MREGKEPEMNKEDNYTHYCLPYLFKTLAIPKSPSLTTPDLVMKIFCVFISLCRIFLS